jgi:hypothetical protein
LGQRNSVSDQSFRLRPECELDSTGCAEQIGNYGKLAAFDAFKQESWAAGCYDSAMNFCYFEVRIDKGIDRNDLIFSDQKVEECAEAPVHLREPEYS